MAELLFEMLVRGTPDGRLRQAVFVDVMELWHRGSGWTDGLGEAFSAGCRGAEGMAAGDFSAFAGGLRHAPNLFDADEVDLWRELFSLFALPEAPGAKLSDVRALSACLTCQTPPSASRAQWAAADQQRPATVPLAPRPDTDGEIFLGFPAFVRHLAGPAFKKFAGLKAAFGEIAREAARGLSAEDAAVVLKCLGYPVTASGVAEMIAEYQSLGYRGASADPPGGSFTFPGFARFLSLLEDPTEIQVFVDACAAFRAFDGEGVGAVFEKDVWHVFRALGRTVSPAGIRGGLASAAPAAAGAAGLVPLPAFLRLLAAEVWGLRDATQQQQQQQDALLGPQQSLCGECQALPATIDCSECREGYCKECCTVVHSKGRRKRHCKFTTVQICGECAVVAASLECTDCSEYYCEACSGTVHGKGRRKLHASIFPIDVEKFRSIDNDASNGFGIHVSHDLTITRFAKYSQIAVSDLAPEELPWNLREAFSLIVDYVHVCKQNGIHFTDPEHTRFHAGDQWTGVAFIALGSETDERNREIRESLERETLKLQASGYDAAASELFVWHRPGQVWNTPFLFTAGNNLLGDWPSCLPKPATLIPNLVKFVEGGFKDAWLALPLAIVATHAELFRNLFVCTDYATLGIYAFQFFDVTQEDPVWSPVVVDNMVPFKLSGQPGEETKLVPLFGRTEEDAELWAILLMKAYAKFRGAYSYLHGGSVPRAFAELSGGQATVERWSCKRISDESVCLLWWKLHLSDRLGLMTACFHIENNVCSSDMETLEPDQEGQITWTEGEHVVLACDFTANSVLQLMGKRVPGGLKLLKLRNLYGRSTVPGDWDWSPASPQWNNKMIRKALHYTRVDDCVRWIDIEEFARRYNTVVRVANFANSPFVRFQNLEPCPRSKTPCFAHQFLLTVAQTVSEEGALLANTLRDEQVDLDNLYVVPGLSDDNDSSDEEHCNPDDGESARSGKSGASGARRSVKRPGTVLSGSSGKNSNAPQEKKGLTVKVFVSQPNLTALSDANISRKGLDFKVFRLPGKGLQQVEEVQEDDDSDIVFKWQTYNEVPLDCKVVNEPTSNPEKQKELSLLESLKQFTVTKPGFYIVAVEQENYMDAVDYCAAISSKELSVTESSDLSVTCEFVGTYMDPVYRLDKRGDGSSVAASSFRHSVVGG
ncbi:Calpain-type cysteine protease DEK1 [Diplonema papillatum]|nr:Calpain-type cysteine protease DEK1 [Diplonema papillatum]